MRIMIADRSAVVRTIIQQNLNKNEFQILVSVSTCEKILEVVKNQTPDVILFGNDINENSEKAALIQICNKFNIPVLVLSQTNTNITLPVITKYIEIIQKPNIKGYTSDFFSSLIKKLQQLVSRNPSASANTSNSNKYKILCIGASTGGPTAVCEVLSGLGKNFNLPILYAQHIEIGKDEALVNWLGSVCKNLTIKLAEDGEEAKAGFVYMAPADTHLVIKSMLKDSKIIISLSHEEPERYLRPAVNKLFDSAAKNYKCTTLAVLLTGMGADGARGCKNICENDGWTIVEDKSTCAVFGMPAAAIEAGGAKEILPRNEIAGRILELVRE